MPGTPVRTLVVDDEKPGRARLLGLLKDRPEVEVVGVAADGREAVDLVRELRPQLMFLDIEMPDLDGFGVLGTVPKALMPAVVFVTAYDRFAMAAFEAHAVDYLLKPFGDERFESALSHALESIRTSSVRDRELRIEGVLEERSAVNARSGYLDRVVIRTSGKIVIVAAQDIDWISAAGVYLELHVGAATYLYRSGMTAFLQRLDPRTFVRVHRSAAVNTSRIVELRPKGHGDYGVVLKGGREIPLSRAYRSELEGWLGQPL